MDNYKTHLIYIIPMTDVIPAMPLLLDHHINYQIKDVENGNLAINIIALRKQAFYSFRFAWNAPISGGLLFTEVIEGHK